MEQIDLITSVIFVVEAVLKIITLGFFLNGKESYLRSLWNVLDFGIVFAILISFFVPRSIEAFKVTRLLRILRPLRLISRFDGLRTQISALLNSLPKTVNLMLICLFLLILFAILGVNFYKGLFYTC